ncbi:MAG: radical SAM protein [Chloroflexi bacterium GWB2_49_20]|nr:MAG: radical SAM protein [Chloroflexi bacterium GWB2_49_20]OGN78923.1 MAG: radical SAM protein [Chloroflexi bacterium GWC2_49_37]OGN86316.1 MAG: radical SAM protein [Chloroflexi bacterium GWD2_49_16]HBG74544.1 radical SAM protein [Anaerolineae bacterium]
MRVFAETGDSKIATVYMADFGDEKIVEFVEALQPPFTRDERWVLMVSTLFGCPVKCMICDAGGQYKGKPTANQILQQIDYLVDKWFPDRIVPSEKFKIQFARMGEPALNPAVLEVLETLPSRYTAPGLIPSISTIAPYGSEKFFERLLEIKNKFYQNGRFQFQYSLHTTDQTQRNKLIPVRKWGFAQLAVYGDKFFRTGDRKITLNFALAEKMSIDEAVLLKYFDPQKYLIKITPVNPTCQAVKNGLVSYIDPSRPEAQNNLTSRLNKSGYDVIVSIGELEENQIGSNCGQYVLKYLQSQNSISDGYTYPIQSLA